MKIKPHICYMCAESLTPAHACSLVRGSVFGSPQGLFDSQLKVSLLCQSSCGILVPFRSLNPSPNSSISAPELYPPFGCGSLHLLQSAVGWSLSQDSDAKLLSELAFLHRVNYLENGAAYSDPPKSISSQNFLYTLPEASLTKVVLQVRLPLPEILS